MKKYLKFMLIVILLFTLCIFVVPNSLSKYKSTIKNSINITIKRPEYTVKFNANGGTGSMSDISVKRDVSQALPSNTFTRSGYDFIGWNTNADGSGVSYSNGQEIAYASISDGEIITLYAQWYNKNYLNDTTELSTYSCEEEVKTFTASITGNYVLDTLTEFNNNGQSIVMVTHDIKSARRGNKIIYLKDGQIIGELELGKYIPDNK